MPNSMIDRFGRQRSCAYLIQLCVAGHSSPFEVVTGSFAAAKARAEELNRQAADVARLCDACWDHINGPWSEANPSPESVAADRDLYRAWQNAFFAEIARWLAAHGVPEAAHELIWNMEPGESLSFQPIEVPLAPCD